MHSLLCSEHKVNLPGKMVACGSLSSSLFICSLVSSCTVRECRIPAVPFLALKSYGWSQSRSTFALSLVISSSGQRPTWGGAPFVAIPSLPVCCWDGQYDLKYCLGKWGTAGCLQQMWGLSPQHPPLPAQTGFAFPREDLFQSVGKRP